MDALRRLYSFALEVYNGFNRDNGFLLAAGIAFFMFFSLFPLLLAGGIALSYVVEDPGLREDIVTYVFETFPILSGFIGDTIMNLIESRGSAGVIALLSLLWSGTGLFGGLALGLNEVYDVKETRNIVVQRLLALLAFFIIIFLLLVSFAASTFATFLRDQALTELLPQEAVSVTITVISVAIGLVSTLLLFLTVYRLVPNVRLSLHNIWFGTLIASIGWEAAKYAFAVYLTAFATEGYGLVYGSFASVILLLFWLNVSAMLLLIGAEINVVYGQRKKGGVKLFEPRKAGE